MVESKKVAIIMVGAPGSGKGTQGKLLQDNTGFQRYVMSDLIKQELTPGTDLHRKVFKEGVLLGDQDIFEIFRNHFQSEDQIIIDGIPRTLDQAYWLYGYLKRHKYTIKLVYLQVDEKQLVKRITSRYYCPTCHRAYNTLFLPPKTSGVCDDDQERLIQREDDTEEVFSQRLELFDEVKDIILEVYEAEEIVVNGDQEINQVSQDILKQIITT